jgi:hypothetical protein
MGIVLWMATYRVALEMYFLEKNSLTCMDALLASFFAAPLHATKALGGKVV